MGGATQPRLLAPNSNVPPFRSGSRGARCGVMAPGARGEAGPGLEAAPPLGGEQGCSLGEAGPRVVPPGRARGGPAGPTASGGARRDRGSWGCRPGVPAGVVGAAGALSASSCGICRPAAVGCTDPLLSAVLPCQLGLCHIIEL